MTDKKIYRTNGNAAIDISAKRTDRLTTKLPNEPPLRRAKTKHKRKAHLMISPLAALGMLVVAMLLITVVFSYVQLYETTCKAGELKARLEELQNQTEKLRTEYQNSISTMEIEQQARAMGMHSPKLSQIHYISVPVKDRGEVLIESQNNIFRDIWTAIEYAFNEIINR